MIKPIEKNDLMTCLEIFHKGYETVAIEFGLTEENCPDRGRAGLPFEKLAAEFESGTMMFGYFLNDRIIGFLGMKMQENGVCKLDDVIILPEYRQSGHGKELLDFCKLKAKELGASKVVLGMIDDNKRLKKWYEYNGFINVGYKKYEGAPFTVGRMECIL
jgi:ribosomal protein S18 acetylase RimI-like enzyme